MNHTELNDIVVLMPSCDRYSSLWPISLEAISRYWPIRPPRTLVVGNHCRSTYLGVDTVLVGTDVSWSDNLLVALDQVQEPYVFLALDDLVMLPGVDTQRLNAALARAVRENWSYFRVNPLPPPATVLLDGLGRCAPGDAYRTSTVWSLWRRDVLSKLLRPGETAWQFEKFGSARSDAESEWWASSRRLVPYVNLVTAGCADPAALQRLARLGHDVAGLAFPPMNLVQRSHHRLRLIRSHFLRWVPRPLRRWLLDRFAHP